MGKRITELPVASAVTTDDLVVIVDSPSGVPETKRATVAQILALASGAAPGGTDGAVQYRVNATTLGGVNPPAGAAKPMVSNGAGVPPIFDSISLANNAAVVAPGAAQELLVNDGTGAVSFADEVRAGGTYLSIGTNPAASGGGRLANNVAWKARNAANSADRQLCVLNGSDVVVLGDTNVAMTLDASSAGVSIPTCLKLGSATVASAGFIRLGGTGAGVKQVVWYDGSADRDIITTDTTGNGISFSGTGFITNVYGSSLTLYAASGSAFIYGAGNERLRVEGAGLSIGGGAGSYGGGDKVAFVINAATNPSSNPTGGGILYADAGAGKWRGSGGTTTTFGPADLDGFKDTPGEGHCPSCGTDFAWEWANEKYGALTVCMKCLTDELGDRPWIVKKRAR